MGKDKKTFKSSGVKLFTFKTDFRNTETDVIYLVTAFNLTKNLLGNKRPSKRLKETEEQFMNYLSRINQLRSSAFLIWRPIYEEYARINYRLSKDLLEKLKN